MIPKSYIAIFGFCLLYSLIVYFGMWPFDGWKSEEIGQFGDSWGVLTSLFSAFAFAAVIQNNIAQKKTIKEAQDFSNKQTAFLDKQTVFLSDQTKALNEQINFLRVQKFESSLFQMLSLLQSLISDIDTIGKTNRSGRDCFKLFYEDLRKEFNASILSGSSDDAINGGRVIVYKDSLSFVYSRFYEPRQQDLGHYFRFLYNMFKFISEAELNADEKRKYGNIVRAQLSNYELAILFYNCIYKEGRSFEKYAIEFKLFDNMPRRMFIRDVHSQLIDKRALGC